MTDRSEYTKLEKTILVDIIEKQQKLVDALEVKVHMLKGQLDSQTSLTDAFSQYMEALDALLWDTELEQEHKLSAARRLVKLTRPGGEDINEQK